MFEIYNFETLLTGGFSTDGLTARFQSSYLLSRVFSSLDKAYSSFNSFWNLQKKRKIQIKFNDRLKRVKVLFYCLPAWCLHADKLLKFVKIKSLQPVIFNVNNVLSDCWWHIWIGKDVEKSRHIIFYDNITASDRSQGENLCVSIFITVPL